MNTLINEMSEHGPMAVDIYQKLSSSRILFIYDSIDDQLATDIVASLILLEAEDPFEKISLYINSDGGDIRNVFMIHDMMQIVQSPIETICVGSALNEAVLLLVSGTKGMRKAYPNALICASQLSQEKYYYSDLSNAKGVLERIQKDNKDYMSLIAKKTDKKVLEVMSDFERKKFMSAKQAKTYGIIDSIVGVK